jgi:hypothetical protein
MTSRTVNHHIYYWLEKVENNIAEFKLRTDVTDAEKAEFITFQYHLVMLINKALEGNVIFTGANPIERFNTVEQNENLLGV